VSSSGMTCTCGDEGEVTVKAASGGFVDLRFDHCACWCPSVVALECGQYDRICLEVGSGKVCRYSASR